MTTNSKSLNHPTVTNIVKRSPIEEALYHLPRDHSGNAEAIRLLTDDSIRFNDHRSWYVWTGTQWQDNEQLVKLTVSEALRKRRDVYDKVDAGSLLALNGSRENVSGTMWMLQSQVNEELSFFDSAPDLLPAPNGIINLRTGKLIPHDKAYGFTFNTTVDYDPKADYSQWETFLMESLQAGIEELDALKIWSGYMLTGRTDDERMLYLYGPAGSGKGTYVDTMKSLVPSPISQSRGFGSFTAKRTDDTQHFDYAGLERSRMLHAHESSRFLELNGPTIKSITSDELWATYKGKQGFNFLPNFKLVLTSNWPPNVDADDDAAWARLVVVHFPVAHRDTAEEDTSLKALFQQPAQLQGVLKWAVEGAQMWYERSKNGKVGLLIPQSYRDLKQKHRDELDKVKEWLGETSEECDDCCTPSSLVIPAYEEWCKANGVEPKRARSFATAMENKGYKPGKCGQVRGYKGLKLKDKALEKYYAS